MDSSFGEMKSLSIESCTVNNKPGEKGDDLLGKWGIYSTGNDEESFYCNVCPTVAIMANGKGLIEFPSGPHELIVWKREKDRLIIWNTSAAKDHGKFADGEYSMDFEEKDGSFGVRLTHIKTSDYYQLRR